MTKEINLVDLKTFCVRSRFQIKSRIASGMLKNVGLNRYQSTYICLYLKETDQDQD